MPKEPSPVRELTKEKVKQVKKRNQNEKKKIEIKTATS